MFFTNEERAEEYLYSRKKYSTVVTGSGLIGDISNSFSNDKVFNLALPFSGSCSGVEILALSNKIPKTLLIETNCIFKGYDLSLIKKLFFPLNHYIKLFLPCFQKKHHLLALVKHVVKRFKPAKLDIERKKQKFDEQQLKKFQNFYNQPPHADQIVNDIKKLKKYLDTFSDAGCRIIFFEMPVEKSLATSLLANFQRETLKKVFSENAYLWIDPEISDMYNTMDGIHLFEESAHKYFDYLNNAYMHSNTSHI